LTDIKYSNAARSPDFAVGKHIRDKGPEGGRKVGGFKREIREALNILSQSPTLNRDHKVELQALCGDVSTHDLVCPS